MNLPDGPSRATGALAYFHEPYAALERYRARYGDAFTLRIPYEQPWVVLSDPQAVQDVFRGDPDVLHSGAANEILVPLLGSTSVLVLDGADHLRARRLLLPPFHGDALRSYAAMIREITAEEVAKWPLGRPVRALDTMQQITLRVIVKATLGERADHDVELRKAIRALLNFSVRPDRMVLMGILGARRQDRVPGLRKVIDDLDRLLLAEIARRRAQPGAPTDIIDLILAATYEDGRPVSDQDARNHLITVLLAGHDTTASALAWALERLSRQPETYERMRGDEAYVAATAKEVLRLRPVLPLVVRQVKAPFTAGDLRLEPGCIAAPCIHLVHRREDLYPDPDQLRPERFLDGDPPHAQYFPFGGGVRRCIGVAFAMLEMREVLGVLADRLTFAAPEPAPERIGRRGITLAPKSGATVIPSAR